jgi:hypothetical protein
MRASIIAMINEKLEVSRAFSPSPFRAFSVKSSHVTAPPPLQAERDELQAVGFEHAFLFFPGSAAGNARLQHDMIRSHTYRTLAVS